MSDLQLASYNEKQATVARRFGCRHKLLPLEVHVGRTPETDFRGPRMPGLQRICFAGTALSRQAVREWFISSPFLAFLLVAAGAR